MAHELTGFDELFNLELVPVAVLGPGGEANVVREGVRLLLVEEASVAGSVCPVAATEVGKKMNKTSIVQVLALMRV